MKRITNLEEKTITIRLNSGQLITLKPYEAKALAIKLMQEFNRLEKGK